jgi:DNA-binding MarR family transcriptional regulator
MARPRQSTHDRVLWTLVDCDGMVDLSILSRRLKMTQEELEPVLDDLEQEGRIIRLNRPKASRK